MTRTPLIPASLRAVFAPTALLCLALLAGGCAPDDAESGLRAFEEKDYATATAIWKKLAQANDSTAHAFAEFVHAAQVELGSAVVFLGQFPPDRGCRGIVFFLERTQPGCRIVWRAAAGEQCETEQCRRRENCTQRSGDKWGPSH